MRVSRRDFLYAVPACTLGAAFSGIEREHIRSGGKESRPVASHIGATNASATLPPLDPARYIWYPSTRWPANTFAFFRRELHLTAKPTRATGWIMADSRYLLEVNGKRVQWGPTTSDPRWPEADPLDLTDILCAGINSIGSTVVFYGHPDGGWITGKPGFLFWLQLEFADGSRACVVSDAQWKTKLATAWRPGMYQRFSLKALQEVFDARAYPYGWTTPTFTLDDTWRDAMVIDGSPNKPPVSTGYYHYTQDIDAKSSTMELRPRSVAMIRETRIPARRLAASGWLHWKQRPEEYFDLYTPDAVIEDRAPSCKKTADGAWEIRLDEHCEQRSAALTFEFGEQVVGQPYVRIEASAGTIVELLVQEAHDPSKLLLLNAPYYSWARVVCRDGMTDFVAFNLESCRWMQLLVRGPKGTVKVHEAGIVRHAYPFPKKPHVSCSEPALQRLVKACVNTLVNSTARGVFVDGEAREAQVYSGDVAHQMHAAYFALGETQMQKRFLAAFSQGQAIEGYFFDCWPAPDRLIRIWEREVQLTGWGPLLDHGIGFNFDCHNHYMYTGELQAISEPYPRLLRFFTYLRGIAGDNNLLPVEHLGVPSVWMDHTAYREQRHKQCAFNLYASAMCLHALAPLCKAFGDTEHERVIRRFGYDILEAAIKRFWSKRHGMFVNNLPWLNAEKTIRLCDRSLATSVLFNQCPGEQTASALTALASSPSEMGCSYPPNRYWVDGALTKGGNAQAVLDDWRKRWATMPSVVMNNTIGEWWTTGPDTQDQWSHCGIVPLCMFFMGIAGIQPLAPGFTRCQIRPQLADLQHLELTAHTIRGPIEFSSDGLKGNRSMRITMPSGCDGRLVVHEGECIQLAQLATTAHEKLHGLAAYRIPSGKTVEVQLRRT